MTTENLAKLRQAMDLLAEVRQATEQKGGPGFFDLPKPAAGLENLGDVWEQLWKMSHRYEAALTPSCPQTPAEMFDGMI